MPRNTQFTVSCPTAVNTDDCILMAHGGGGTLMNRLIRKTFLSRFDSDRDKAPHDSAVVRVGPARIAMTTDSFVVNPLFFPGGNIGSLAVHGTVNDLAMSGAKPLFLSAAYILEEGLAVGQLERIIDSMAEAARQAEVTIITGDTKVVDKGKGDGVFINTTGIGIVEGDREISPASIRPGDAIVVSGDIGRHGIAIMAEREGIQFESQIRSDSASVAHLVRAILDAGLDVHCMRDLTRGGLASALNELATDAVVRIEIDEAAVPVRADVQSACELLGFDPLYVACEGRFVSFINPDDAAAAIEIMNATPIGSQARLIGHVIAADSAGVIMRTRIGSSRIVEMLSGEQLPRIC